MNYFKNVPTQRYCMAIDELECSHMDYFYNTFMVHFCHFRDFITWNRICLEYFSKSVLLCSMEEKKLHEGEYMMTEL